MLLARGIISQLQTSFILNSPKTGNTWIDMLLIPFLIGLIGSLVTLMWDKLEPIWCWLICKYRNMTQGKQAHIEYEGSIIYGTYRTHVNFDLGMLSWFYYMFNNLEQLEGLRSFRRIADSHFSDRDNNQQNATVRLFEEFFLSQDSPVYLPNGMEIHPQSDNGQRMIGDDYDSDSNKRGPRTLTYKMKVVSRGMSTCELNMQRLLTEYQNVLDLYLEHKKELINSDRQYVYMYSGKTDDKVKFNRYNIEEEPKRFTHIWFEGKDALLQDLQHFIENREFYRKKGKPYRKTILAYGEPGCGKTSLLMSLLNFMKCQKGCYKRHLIHLKLDKLSRNELMNILFREEFLVEDTLDRYVKIPFDRRIYYIEEMDTYKMTHQRENDKLKSQDDDSSTSEPEDLVNLVTENKTSNEDSNGLNSLVKLLGPEQKKHESQLLIGDLLEALDGIPSMKNGEIVFMTTNHIDKIDAAIKRPGRINHLIHFQRSTVANTVQQVEAYFEEKLSSVQFKNIPGKKWTPAEIELICDSSSTIDQAVEKLTVSG